MDSKTPLNRRRPVSSKIPTRSAYREPLKQSSGAKRTPSGVILKADGRPFTSPHQDVTPQGRKNKNIGEPQQVDSNSATKVAADYSLQRAVEGLSSQSNTYQEPLNLEDTMIFTDRQESGLHHQNSIDSATFYGIPSPCQEMPSRVFIRDSSSLDGGLERHVVFSFVRENQMDPDSSGCSQRLSKLNVSNSFMNVCKANNKQNVKSVGMSCVWITSITLIILITSLILYLTVLLANRVEYLVNEISRYGELDDQDASSWLQWLKTIWERMNTILSTGL
ncbi:uncharacterized protein LOC131432071 [Malaya genurostris]|uniref:uncharacterized protein LOC131432071 n=1 Tax=Malaya genurostris TaxID=325434 RepID=UPI0026F3DFBD|nr:uncharacterized protein LOC131432071 [Malaya genurostris]